MKNILAICCVMLVAIAQAQIISYPSLQSFEDPFVAGYNVNFLPNWWGNYVAADTMGQYTGFAHTGTQSLFMIPQGEEFKIMAQARLDLKNVYNTYVDFWVATRKRGLPEDEKRIKLNVAISINGGVSFPYVIGVGTEEGFVNADTEFQKFTVVFPPATNNQSNVVLRFISKTGGGPHLQGILLIDDVSIAQAESDIFPPYLMGTEPTIDVLNMIKVPFSEPISAASLKLENLKFTWPVDEHTSSVVGEGPLPTVKQITQSADGYSIMLSISPALSVGETYNLEMYNLTDLNGNVAPLLSMDGLVYNVPLPGSLVFSEILFNDPSEVNPKEKLQYIELYNPTSEVVPLGGLRIKGAIASHNLPNVKLKPGEYWVTTRNADAYYATFGKSAWEWKGSWIQYNSHTEGGEGEEAEVGDESEEGEWQSLYIETTNRHGGKLVDSIAFNFKDPRWSVLSKAGYSIEVCNYLSDKLNPANWSLSNDNRLQYNYNVNGTQYKIFATPGAGCYTSNVPVAYCTYSQGFYSSENGYICSSDELKLTSYDVMHNALPIQRQQLFGLNTTNRYFLLKGTDISSGAIYNMLPGGKTPAPIKYTGGATYSMPGTWSAVPLNKLTGKIENVLLSQTISLYFNMSLTIGSYSLANFTLKPVILTAKSADCGNSIAVPEQYEYVKISQKVIDYLAANYADGAKVVNLYKLANRILGGDPALVSFASTGKPTYKLFSASEVASAVELINTIFEECRIYIPDNRLLTVATLRSSEAETYLSDELDNEYVQSVQIYPNPFAGQTSIRIASPVDTYATLQIFTVEGVELARLFEGELAANEPQNITFTPVLSQSGLYVYRFTTGSFVKTGKIQVVK